MTKKKKSTEETPRRLTKVYQEEADKRLKERKAIKAEKDAKKAEEPEEEIIEEVPEVTKFTFKTQTSGTANYTGPSGINYIINRGNPFQVDDPRDIAFFESNPRFGKVSIFSKKPEKPKDLDEQLRDYLNGIKGISKKTIEEVVKTYINKNNLVDELQQGYKMHNSIPNSHAGKIRAYVLKEIAGDK